jgi:hypothetical protein
MANQQISNPPTTAYYLTLIGGILGLLGGLVITIILAFTIFLVPIGIWIIIANVLMIVYAKRLMAEPKEYSKYGLYILLLAIFSGPNIICLIGGILTLVHQPMPTHVAAQPSQTYAPPTYASPTQAPAQYASSKYCPQCGNPVGVEAAYCPKCGTKMPI